MTASDTLTAAQYRDKALRELERSQEVPAPVRDYALFAAKIYASLAISRQLAENQAERTV